MKRGFYFLMSMLFVLVMTGTVTAQVDSATAYNLIQVGLNTVNTVHPTDFVPGVNNNALASIITAISGFILTLLARRREKKNLRAQGKLND